MGPVWMTLLLVVSFGIFAWSAWRRWHLMLVPQAPDNRADRVGERIRSVLVYMFGQKRMPRYPAAGFAHIVVFFGFLVLLLNTLILWGRGYVRGFDFWIFGLDQPLGLVYAFFRDIFTVLVIVGVVIFFYNRVVARLSRLTLNAEGLLILGIIFAMMIADLLYEGGELLHHAAPGERPVHAAMPFGSLTALLMSGLPAGAVDFLWGFGFWAHSALVLIFLNLLPYGKHFHVITTLPNVFCRNLAPSGRLPKLEDIEGRLEREETLGVKTVRDLSWKAALDFYTCTECGRCSDFCPANRTGKLLSPKHLMLALRDHMYLREKQLLRPTATNSNGQADEAALEIAPPGPPNGTRDATHTREADAPRALQTDVLAPVWVNPEVLWACTTCAACETECPVFITYIDKIVGMRRHLVMERGEFPEQLQNMFQGLERVGNPYSIPNEQRAEWAEGLGVPLRSDKPDAEWLFWVGCSPSFDDRARKIARATAMLLQEAGIDFAILGPEEMCNGDPARRAGNEYLFQMMAQQNIEIMNGYNVKKIVACCPHCFNTLKNEYSDFGGQYEVWHHSQLLARLVQEGRLRPTQRVDATIAYHDACYLGRHNEVYDPPRAVLERIPGVRLVEPEETRDRGMCCGAGGAQMWKEEEEGHGPDAGRVNHRRTNQLLKVLPSNNGAAAASSGAVTPSNSAMGRPTIASACPFCMTMLTDGLRDQGHENVDQLDIAEVLLRAVRDTTPAPAAEASAPSEAS